MYLLLIIPVLLGASPSTASVAKCLSVFSGSPESTLPSRKQPPRLAKPLKIDNFPKESLPRLYLEMAKEASLQPYYNSELESRGLIIPGGGLCLSACMVNVLGSLLLTSEQIPYFKDLSNELLISVVAIYSDIAGHDGREGAYASVYSAILPQIVSELTDGKTTENFVRDKLLKTTNHDAVITPENLKALLSNNALGVATILPTDPIAAEEIGGHAVVVLKIDTVAKTVYLSDPGAPNEILIRPYKRTGDSFIFKMPTTGYDQLELHIQRISAFAKRTIDM